jgi:hypothetical protein
MESRGPRDRQIGPFAVGVPEGFTLRPGGTTAFGSDAAELVYSTEAVTSDPWAQAALRYGLGVQGSAGIIRWGACATSGVLPLTAKAALLGSGSAQRLLFDGGIAIVRRSGDGSSALLAFSGPEETDLIVTVNSTDEIDNQLLEEIVALAGLGPRRIARRTD